MMKLYDYPIETEAVIHSLDGKLDKAEILGLLNEQQYVARYDGVICSAIFNVFNYHYYVDDKYGILSADWKMRYMNG